MTDVRAVTETTSLGVVMLLFQDMASLRIVETARPLPQRTPCQSADGSFRRRAGPRHIPRLLVDPHAINRDERQLVQSVRQTVAAEASLFAADGRVGGGAAPS